VPSVVQIDTVTDGRCTGIFKPPRASPIPRRERIFKKSRYVLRPNRHSYVGTVPETKHEHPRRVLEEHVLSPLAAEYAQRANNRGPLESSTHVGRYGSEGGGPYMILWLEIKDEVIRAVAYQTYGCPAAMACGSITCALVKGRDVDEAMRLTAEDLIYVLGGLPEGKGECAKYAIVALRDALNFGLYNLKVKTNALP
jgi:nitrogen fixation NifU-like protein